MLVLQACAYMKRRERMQNQIIKHVANAQKFHDPEQLWFWFLHAKQTRGDFRGGARSCGRICELLDVETLITKLYLSGKLTDEQLNIMKQFGDRRRAPHQHIWSENHAAALWRDAMRAIESAAMTKGWIE
jgi:hypothetical protein